ncbi:Actin-binding protein IPP [Eumeta japonica]|uniref:Actin-binding protein IPP n=1 Tax=Eumeta variegata TaxID=151549 RepID=A0A4C1WK05_EUMVA|nr:Actin-binding protein IPP [Eumeta japonica]
MDFHDNEVLLSSKNAAANFEEFRQNMKFLDVTLQSGHAIVKAHRAVLAAASPYFEAVFNASLKDNNEDLVNVPDIPPALLPSLIEFIYTGHVTIKSSTVRELMVAAHMLHLEDLVKGCARYLKMQCDASNALSLLSFAEKLTCSEFTEYVLAYIGDYWENIILGKDFLELSLSLFIKILSSAKFTVEDELEVLRAVVRWLEHKPAARTPYCAELIRLLRLRRVPLQALEAVWREVGDPWLLKTLRRCSMITLAQVVNARARSCCAFYVVGHSDYCKMNLVFKYDIYRKVWKVVVPMDTHRRCAGVAALGGLLYVVGGRTNNIPVASGSVYDPVTNKWSPIADMDNARSEYNLVSLKGKLYAMGGDDGVRRLSSIEVYDPAADEWSPAGHLPRHSFRLLHYSVATACNGG